MRIPIMSQDMIGVVSDIEAHDLPLNAWSNVRNMRFIDGRVEKMLGHAQVFTPAVDPLFFLPVNTPNGYAWIYASQNDIYAYQNGSSTKLTRAAGIYSAPLNSWTGGVLNGVPILNNFSDVPQMWSPPNLGTLCTALTNWPATWRAKSLRPFKNFLVSLGTTKGAVANPYLVNWSHPADPGTVPVSWDIADATKDAGEVTLADTDDGLVDQRMLGHINMLYKENCAYRMQLIGGNDIFDFKLMDGETGLLAPGAVQTFQSSQGPRHIVFGPNDVYVHNGFVAETFLRKRQRRWLYKNLDSSNARNSFLVHAAEAQEMWVCFPEVGQIYPNLALIWNYKNDVVTFRDLPGVSAIATGRVTDGELGPVVDTWDDGPGTWDQDDAEWGFGQYAATNRKLLMATAGTNRKAYVLDQTTQFSGQTFLSFVEREGLTVAGIDKATGKPIEDIEVVKLVKEVWPRVTGTPGTRIDIFVGVQEARDLPTKWKGPYPYIIGQSKKINPLVSGRLISIRFECRTDSSWALAGYDLEIEPLGKY